MLPCRIILWLSAIVTLIVLIIIGFSEVTIPVFAFFGGLTFAFATMGLLIGIIGLLLLRSTENLFNNKKLLRSFACISIFALLLIIVVLITSVIFGPLLAILSPILFAIFVFLIAGLVFSILEAVVNFIYVDYCNIRQSNTTSC